MPIGTRVSRNRKYECSPGFGTDYVIPDQVAQCRQDGAWSVSPLICQPITRCPQFMLDVQLPVTVEMKSDLYVEGDFMPLAGSVVVFSCPNQLAITNRTCLTSGQWNDFRPAIVCDVDTGQAWSVGTVFLFVFFAIIILVIIMLLYVGRKLEKSGVHTVNHEETMVMVNRSKTEIRPAKKSNPAIVVTGPRDVLPNNSTSGQHFCRHGYQTAVKSLKFNLDPADQDKLNSRGNIGSIRKSNFPRRFSLHPV
ncbi:hypothetical protein HDE_05853 [Halotydeus destructor]|nr:hypothetical protein HDE_05853 [Halotydeus destructor]